MFILEIDTLNNKSLSWIDGMTFCIRRKSMLRIPGILAKDDDYTWIGISRRHAKIQLRCRYYNNTEFKGKRR